MTEGEKNLEDGKVRR